MLFLSGECGTFPECVARVPVSHGGLGAEGVFARRCVLFATVRNRPQPSATVRNRSQPSAAVRAIPIWPCRPKRSPLRQARGSGFCFGLCWLCCTSAQARALQRELKKYRVRLVIATWLHDVVAKVWQTFLQAQPCSREQQPEPALPIARKVSTHVGQKIWTAVKEKLQSSATWLPCRFRVSQTSSADVSSHCPFDCLPSFRAF